MSTLGIDLDPSKGHNLTPHLIETSLQKRYTTISIPSTYGGLNDHLTAGAVVGIVLGSVAGFVLLMYVLFLAVSPKSIARGPPTSASSYTSKDSSVYQGRARSSRQPRRDERSISAHSYRRRSRSRSDRIIVEESQTSGPSRNDVVEVIEDESESEISRPPRRTSRRGGARHIDPLAYGGSENDSRA